MAPAPATEAGKDAKGGANDASNSDATRDAVAGKTPARLLVTVNDSKSSELVAIDLATGKVDGSLSFSGSLGTSYAYDQPYPFLLEQKSDVVARLDSTRPWKVDASWNVTLTDGVDGGYPYTDPVAAIVGGGGKAYVLRYDRNEIAVIDTTSSDGGELGTIDLSSLVQKNDADGIVEMTAGMYVAGKNRLYVVLENIDEDAVSADGEFLYCVDTVSTIVGIDTTTDAIVSLGGTGPQGSIALKGYNPVPGGFVYDKAGDRILLFEEGCYAMPTSDAGDAGAGPRSKGGVEAVSLNDFASTILLDISSDFAPGLGYPSGIAFADEADHTHAVLGFDFTGSEVYRWDTTSPKLGASLVPNAPDVFVSDGAGHLLGTVTAETDAGSSTKVVSVEIATGTSKTLNDGHELFSMPGGFIGGVDIWPQPSPSL